MYDDISDDDIDENRLVIDEANGNQPVGEGVFKEVRPRQDRKRQLTGSPKQSEANTPSKKGKVDRGENLTVFLQGKTRVITQVNPQLVKKSISDQFRPVIKIEKAGKCLKITCQDKKQKDKLLGIKGLIIADIEVNCSEPRAAHNSALGDKANKLTKVVAVGVPTDITAVDICAAAGAETALRLKKRVNGQLTDTMAVLLGYIKPEDVPSHINFEYLRFKVREYTPEPMRCYVCQGFGHKSDKCTRQQTKCSKCAGTHKYTECTNSDLLCVNCKGNHSSASKLCPKYIETKKVLGVANKEQISYRDALKQVRSPRPVQNNTTAPEAVDIPATAPKQVDNPGPSVPETIVNEETTQPESNGPESNNEQANNIAEIDQNKPLSVQNQSVQNKPANDTCMANFCKFFIRFMCLVKTCKDVTTLGDEAIKIANEIFGNTLGDVFANNA